MNYFKPAELACKHCGAQGCLPAAVDKLNELRHAYGHPLVITSAYRCKDHPVEAAKARPGQHNAGVAFDIKVADAGMAYRIQQLAFAMGWRGIALGNGFVHVDMRGGPAASWRY